MPRYLQLYFLYQGNASSESRNYLLTALRVILNGTQILLNGILLLILILLCPLWLLPAWLICGRLDKDLEDY